MESSRDHPGESRDATAAVCEDEPASLRRGQAVRARFGSGVIEGEVIEVRREPAGGRRVVIGLADEDVEVDTDAQRVRPVDRVCPVCDAVLEREHTYRCPECRADLVEG